MCNEGHTKTWRMPLGLICTLAPLLLIGCACATAEEMETPPPNGLTASSIEVTKNVGDQGLTPAQPAQAEVALALEAINLVTQTGLRNTKRIEICFLDCAAYSPLLTIDDVELIAQLVDTLDSDLILRPHARCPATYHLRFVLASGQHHDFGYACEMMSPTFLRGNDEFWRGRDALAPDAFNQMMLSLIAPELTNGG